MCFVFLTEKLNEEKPAIGTYMCLKCYIVYILVLGNTVYKNDFNLISIHCNDYL